MGSLAPSESAGRAVDALAAGLLAAAVGYALYVASDGVGVMSQWTVTIAGAAIGCWLARALIERLAGEPALPLSAFTPPSFEFIPEPVTEVAPDVPPHDDEDELLLEDVLDPVPDKSQVIRLFDPALMPTAGELHEQIDRHLSAGPRPVPDSTQELYAALSALRQSLR